MAVQGVEAIKVLLEQQKDLATNSMDKYRNEWNQIIASLKNIADIRNLAFNGDLKVSKFRSVYWAILLRVLSLDHRTWVEQRKQQRYRYEKLKKEFVRSPHNERECNDDPLSQSEKSIWNQYFNNQELIAVIKQDVVRTFPGVEFFKKPNIQSAMVNILFYYAKEHPYMCYRQGMHEILAPILFVMFGDHQGLLHFMELTEDIDELLMDVLNPEFLEADSYSIFSHLMSYIVSYYRITNLIQSENGYFGVRSDPTLGEPVTTEAEVIGQLNSIREKILAKKDPQLHDYLMKLDIPLHIFGIRWLRLLFGREFPLLDLLIIWDAIFADSDRFDLPNYIVVSMLIHIRDRLLMNDYTTCLTHLMRYPPNIDVNSILRQALHMQIYGIEFEPPISSLSRKFSSATIVPSVKVLPTPSTSLLKDDAPVEKHKRSTSLVNDAKFEKQIMDIQNKNALESAAKSRLRSSAESDRMIIDGYSENSPELLRLELKNVQTIIKISRDKLLQYLDTVKRNATKNPSEDLRQALNGIEELCSFLDVRFIFPYNTRSHPIDQALEADESRHVKVSKTPDRHRTLYNGISSPPDVDKIKYTVNEARRLSVTNGATLYEKPDNGYMANSSRILGNAKEVELIPMANNQARVVMDERKGASGVPSIDPIGHRID